MRKINDFIDRKIKCSNNLNERQIFEFKSKNKSNEGKINENVKEK